MTGVRRTIGRVKHKNALSRFLRIELRIPTLPLPQRRGFEQVTLKTAEEAAIQSYDREAQREMQEGEVKQVEVQFKIEQSISGVFHCHTALCSQAPETDKHLSCHRPDILTNLFRRHARSFVARTST